MLLTKTRQKPTRGHGAAFGGGIWSLPESNRPLVGLEPACFHYTKAPLRTLYTAPVTSVPAKDQSGLDSLPSAP